MLKIRKPSLDKFDTLDLETDKQYDKLEEKIKKELKKVGNEKLKE